MSVITAPVTAARAILDEESGEFAIEARLENGQELRFTSKQPAEKLAALREALSAPATKPKRRRRRRKQTTGTETQS